LIVVAVVLVVAFAVIRIWRRSRAPGSGTPGIGPLLETRTSHDADRHEKRGDRAV
jgi:hypothetical protein